MGTVNKNKLKMNNFVKTLPKDFFKYLRTNFPNFHKRNLKDEIFVKTDML